MQLILPPLDFADASIFLAISAILLLVTSQILPAFYGATGSAIEKRRLDNAAIFTGILFLATVIIKVAGIIMGI